MMLAAGEGTRLRPHTLTLPKPAIPFLNVPLAAFSLSVLGSLRINRLIVNTFHLPEQITAAFQKLPHGADELHFSHEKDEILGSGGGLKNAQKLLSDSSSFVLMNADEVILPADPEIFAKAQAAHDGAGALATLFVTKYPGVGSKFGGVWTQGRKVLGFGKDALPGSDFGWHFIGPQILDKKVFSYLPEQGPSNILYDGLKKAIDAGEKVQIFPVECEWFETGNERDFLEATHTCMNYLFSESSQGNYIREVLNKFAACPQKMETGKKHKGLFAANAQISLDTTLEGFIVVDQFSKVTSGGVLKNVCLGASLSLPENSKFENRLILSL
jgi:mannose-1-phosphate guanylyltransferase